MRKCSFAVLGLLMVLMASTLAYAQEKVVESSASRPPLWLGSAMKDNIIATAQASDLSQAKEMAMNDIRSQIINAVAANVVSVSETNAMSVTVDDKEQYSKSYYSHVRTTAANLPFVSGISMSDNMESYWEKIYVKDKKSYYYTYHLKYYFPKSRLDALIAEYKAMDSERWNRYLELKEELDTFDNVDFISRAINELTALASWFEEGYRNNAVLSLQKSYKGSYSAIAIVPVSNTPGCFTYRIQLNGRDLYCSQKPSLRSEYATKLEWFPFDNGIYTVRYSYDGVMEYDKKEIAVLYRFGTKSVRHIVNFRLE